MQYKQLQLIYEKLYAISLETSEMFSEKQYDSIIKSLEKKDKLIKKLYQTMKILKSESIPEHIEELKNKFLNQEQKNIEDLKNIQFSAKIELNKLTKDIKLISAYSQNIHTASMVDIQE